MICVARGKKNFLSVFYFFEKKIYRLVTASRQTRIEATGPTTLKISKRVASATSGDKLPT